jgi:hypothetical protein
MSDVLGDKLTELAEGVLTDLLEERKRPTPEDEKAGALDQQIAAIKTIGTLYIALKRIGKHGNEDDGDVPISMRAMRERLRTVGAGE